VLFVEHDKNSVPSFDQIIKPVLLALKNLGGIAENDLIDEGVIKIMGLSKEISSILHGKGKRTEISYRIAWAKTYLKKYGLISNPSRGVWSLTEQFNGDVESVDIRQIVSNVNRQSLQNFQNLDMTNLESHEAFERFVSIGLKKYIQSKNKSIEIGDPSTPYDAFLAQGFNDKNIPTYVEIKYISNMRASKDNYWLIIQQIIEKFLDNKEVFQLLIIFGANIPRGIKEELYQQLKANTKFSFIKVILWDYNDFIDQLDDVEVNAEYLVNPKRMLIEDKLLAHLSSRDLQQSKELFIKKLKDAYIKQDVTLFLGAGVSMDAGIPLWGELIHKLLFHMINERMDNLNMDKSTLKEISQLAYQNKEGSPLTQMRYIRTAFEEEEYYNLVHEVLYENNPRSQTKLIDCIVNISTPRRNHIGVKSIVTYNFDNLIEENLQGNKVEFKTIFKEDDISDVNSLSIYHVHGFLPSNYNFDDIQDYNLVFSEEDYHKVYRDAYCWSNIVQLNAFRDSTCLFIGCSLTDPNMRRLLDVAARSEEKPRHFAIMKRKEVTLKSSINKEMLEQYYNIDQNIREGYYQSLGINIIWIDEFNEIPEILNSLLK
jgi:NAD-dependent SIR2 family protein deacetylase